MNGMEIRQTLQESSESEYAQFSRKLIPNIPPDTILGVRTPQLRALAKQAAKAADIEAFLHDLPHRYFEENQLHSFMISEYKDFEQCIAEVERFLPYVDNWATSDQLAPKCFKKHRQELLVYINKWIASEHPYSVRFAVGMLMAHFLDEDFDASQLELVAAVRSDEYYVNMMRAWYFATALTKQYDAALPVLQKQSLDVWTHNKTIQKARESYRIPTEQKEYLKTLKR